MRDLVTESSRNLLEEFEDPSTPLLLHCDGIAFVAVVATAVLLVVGTTLVVTIAIVVSLLL